MGLMGVSAPSLHIEFTDSMIMTRPNVQSPCHSAGLLVRYSTMLFTLLWIVHISSLFWKIYFPITTVSSKNIRRTKYIHVTCLIAALLLSLISPLANYLKGGFFMYDFPSFFCGGRDADVTFYVHILPITILLGVGTSLLVLILWKLHMVYISTFQKPVARWLLCS